MSFTSAINPSACGFCGEHQRPRFVNDSHAHWLDLIFGCWLECPQCGNVFELGEAGEEDLQYVKRGREPLADPFGESIVEQIMEKAAHLPADQE